MNKHELELMVNYLKGEDPAFKGSFNTLRACADIWATNEEPAITKCGTVECLFLEQEVGMKRHLDAVYTSQCCIHLNNRTVPEMIMECYIHHILAVNAGGGVPSVEPAISDEEIYKHLQDIQSIIADASKTGFNYNHGDWVERLFNTNRKTSDILKDRTGHHAGKGL